MIRWRNTLKIITPPDYLCFTANTAGSTVQLTKKWSPTAVSLETSTDWKTRADYTIGNTITLANVWDKVYMRNKSETTTWFSTSDSKYYNFVMTWSIAWSWDVNYLLCKNSTTTLANYCYYYMFYWCTWLITAPELPATTLANYCYNYMFNWCTSLITAPQLPATTLANNCYGCMFYWCTSLTTLPQLPATTLTEFCYRDMFNWCSKIKLSTTQTWEYQTPYRIPTSWTWTTASYALNGIFNNTGWTFTWTPSINTTYYTSNTVV